MIELTLVEYIMLLIEIFSLITYFSLIYRLYKLNDFDKYKMDKRTLLGNILGILIAIGVTYCIYQFIYIDTLHPNNIWEIMASTIFCIVLWIISLRIIVVILECIQEILYNMAD